MSVAQLIANTDGYIIGQDTNSTDTISFSGSYNASNAASINNSGVWSGTNNSGNETWTFTQSTGDLNLVLIPEPAAALLDSLGLPFLLRHRRS